MHKLFFRRTELPTFLLIILFGQLSIGCSPQKSQSQSNKDSSEPPFATTDSTLDIQEKNNDIKKITTGIAAVDTAANIVADTAVKTSTETNPSTDSNMGVQDRIEDVKNYPNIPAALEPEISTNGKLKFSKAPAIFETDAIIPNYYKAPDICKVFKSNKTHHAVLMDGTRFLIPDGMFIEPHIILKAEITSDDQPDYVLQSSGCGSGGCPMYIFIGCADKTAILIPPAELYSHGANIAKTKTQWKGRYWSDLIFYGDSKYIHYPEMFKFHGMQYESIYKHPKCKMPNTEMTMRILVQTDEFFEEKRLYYLIPHPVRQDQAFVEKTIDINNDGHQDLVLLFSPKSKGGDYAPSKNIYISCGGTDIYYEAIRLGYNNFVDEFKILKSGVMHSKTKWHDFKIKGYFEDKDIEALLRFNGSRYHVVEDTK